MKSFLLFVALLPLSLALVAQTPADTVARRGLVANLNKEGTANVRFITLVQTWVRWLDLNPGTVYKGKERTSITDVALRRLVFTGVAQLNPRTLLLLNVSASANSGDIPFQTSLNFGVIDAYGEYKFGRAFYLGAGLHQWTGFSRLNEEGIGSLINVDQPTFPQITWNKNDKLGRFLGVYAKGSIGKVDYRLSVNEAFTAPTTVSSANTGKGSPNGGVPYTDAPAAQVNVAYFNPCTVSKIFQGYFTYSFWEQEQHVIPYEVSSYQGSRKIFNLGAGLFFRKAGMLVPTRIELRDPALPPSKGNQPVVKDATEKSIVAYAVDAVCLLPFGKNKEGLALYGGYFRTDLGPNYYTITNILNPASASPGLSPINGSGNGYPAAGTGHSLYGQAGYIAPSTWFGKTRAGVFGTFQHSRFEALQDPVNVYEAGVNWFIDGNKLKLTAQYRSRPIFSGTAAYQNFSSTAVVTQRKSEVITQLQFNF